MLSQRVKTTVRWRPPEPSEVVPDGVERDRVAVVRHLLRERVRPAGEPPHRVGLREVEVLVRGSWPNEYLATEADTTTTNNLDNLPDC